MALSFARWKTRFSERSEKRELKNIRLNLEVLEDRCVPSNVTTTPPELSAVPPLVIAADRGILNQIIQTDKTFLAGLERADQAQISNAEAITKSDLQGAMNDLGSGNVGAAGKDILSAGLQDFSLLPPEINSALLYSGAGSAPLMSAASAWDALAADLQSSAQGFDNVILQLASQEWSGPNSAGMATAAAPYIEWMTTTASQAEQANTQSVALAAAYEQAFAQVVPPALITANRNELATLVSTNFLGQNTPAIAATEAQHMEMWAQDVAAMKVDASGGFQ